MKDGGERDGASNERLTVQKKNAGEIKRMCPRGRLTYVVIKKDRKTTQKLENGKLACWSKSKNIKKP